MTFLSLLRTLLEAFEGFIRGQATQTRLDDVTGLEGPGGHGFTASRPISSTGYDREAEEDLKRTRIVGFCEMMVGQPYRYGVEHKFDEENPEAWDCSELIENAYNRVHVPYPDGCINQKALIGHRRVLEPKAGDPFFYGPNAQGIPHTGIYTGRGTVISALGGKVGHVVEQARYDVENHPRFEGWYRHTDFSWPAGERA